MPNARTRLFGIASEHDALLAAIEDVEWLKIEGPATLADIGKGFEVEFALVNLEHPDGMKTVRALTERVPACRIIAIGESDPQQIISAMRAGCAQYVSMPVEPEELKNAFESARPQRLGLRQTVCVIGSSSGAGATTLVCNLALEMAQRSGRCAVVDLDLEFGNVACAFDCEPRYTVADVCGPGSRDHLDQTVLSDALVSVGDIALLGRPHSIEQAGGVDPTSVDKAIRLLGEMFPSVVVDLSRINGELGHAALRHADRILIVVQLNVTCVRNAERIYRMLVGAGLEPSKVFIVVNRAESSGLLEASKVETFLKAPILAYLPNDYTRVRKALDIGISEDDHNPVRHAVRELVARLSGEVTIEAVKPKGLIKRLVPFSAPSKRVKPRRVKRPLALALYGLCAVAGIVLVVLTLPWFTRVVHSTMSSSDL